MIPSNKKNNTLMLLPLPLLPLLYDLQWTFLMTRYYTLRDRFVLLFRALPLLFHGTPIRRAMSVFQCSKALHRRGYQIILPLPFTPQYRYFWNDNGRLIFLVHHVICATFITTEPQKSRVFFLKATRSLGTSPVNHILKEIWKTFSRWFNIPNVSLNFPY